MSERLEIVESLKSTAQFERNHDGTPSTVDALEAAASLITALAEAVKPFAKRAGDIDDIVMDGEAILAPALAGDLRRARAAYLLAMGCSTRSFKEATRKDNSASTPEQKT